MKKLLFVQKNDLIIASTAVECCDSDSTVKINDKITIDGSAIELTAAAGKKNSDFLYEASLTTAVDAAFKASTDETVKAAVKDTDYIILVAKPKDDQKAGPLEFIVKGIGKLSGLVKFTVDIKAGA